MGLWRSIRFVASSRSTASTSVAFAAEDALPDRRDINRPFGAVACMRDLSMLLVLREG